MKISHNNQQNFKGILGSKPTERTVNLLMQELGRKKVKEVTFKFYNAVNPRMADYFKCLYDDMGIVDKYRIIFTNKAENKKIEYISFAMQEFIRKLIPEEVRVMQPKKWYQLKHQYSIPFEEIRKLSDTMKEANKVELHQIIKKSTNSLACFLGKVMNNIVN